MLTNLLAPCLINIWLHIRRSGIVHHWSCRVYSYTPWPIQPVHINNSLNTHHWERERSRWLVRHCRDDTHICPNRWVERFESEESYSIRYLSPWRRLRLLDLNRSQLSVKRIRTCEIVENALQLWGIRKCNKHWNNELYNQGEIEICPFGCSSMVNATMRTPING